MSQSGIQRMQYQNGRQLHADPPVWRFDGFAREDESAALLDAARDLLQSAQVSVA